MISVDVLLSEVERLGGSLVLLIDEDGDFLRLRFPQSARWLRDEIRRRKPEVVTELKWRYLQRIQ